MKFTTKAFLICLLYSVVLMRAESAYVAEVMWSFDNLNGTKVIPAYTTNEKYVADLSPLGDDMDAVLAPGIQGNAVYVNGTTFKLASGIKNVCLGDPDACKYGSVMSFQLKIENWNNAEAPVIFRTSPIDRNAAGMYFGKGDDDNLLVYYRGSTGRTYSLSFSQSKVWKQWGNIAIRWSAVGHVYVYVNSVRLNVQPTSTENVPTFVPFTDLVVGSTTGPSFYLDEFYVYYGYGTPPATTTTTTTTTTPIPQTTTARSPTTKATSPSTTQSTTTEATTPSTITTTTATTQERTTEAQTTTLESTTGSGVNTTSHAIAVTEKSSETYWNIWVPILIAVLAFAGLMACFLCHVCVRKRRRRKISHPDVVAFTQVKGGYARASAIEPYQDEGSNMETEDTDGEEHSSGRLLSTQPIA